MLKARQDITDILNGFLSKYSITRAFTLKETAFVPGIKKITVEHNEAGLLKLNINFFTSYNEVCKMVILHCIINSVNKSEELEEYYNKLAEVKK